ncbi:HU family DNA-binding protein [Frigidibacter sp. ROC022]|uniref:HU family DNA-binding protein n=1 Tax=Frigidibacter sp. ROC022 TaxID=2971796 RepID=UPI00215A18EC|nr:HU family DNA-binding protein [Frigidibacter sp. ROC022]MCR8725623.1 HU family DNA-binding protein [Frigidibacter sp. ROC022]
MKTAAEASEIITETGGGAKVASGNNATIYRKKELVDAVVASSGLKKKTVKPVVDAVLAEIGVALSRGDALNMPPLGKLLVNRTKDGPASEVLILKLRRVKPGARARALAGAPQADASGEDDAGGDDDTATAAE